MVYNLGVFNYLEYEKSYVLQILNCVNIASNYY